MREIHVKILRGTGDSDSFYQSYVVSVEDTASVSVMNLLEEIYNRYDHSLAFFSHAACRQAACGKCMVRANGKVVLACKAQADAPYEISVSMLFCAYECARRSIVRCFDEYSRFF